MVQVTLNENGTVEIPRSVRERLRMQPGVRLELIEDSGQGVLHLRLIPDEVLLVEKEGVWVLRGQLDSAEEEQSDPLAALREERIQSLQEST